MNDINDKIDKIFQDSIDLIDLIINKESNVILFVMNDIFQDINHIIIGINVRS